MTEFLKSCAEKDTLTAEDRKRLVEVVDKVAEVVKCKDCIYYHKEHILCNDGTEKDVSEFSEEALDLTGKFVTISYGINVGGKCELEKNCGYEEDKSVYRNFKI